MRNYCVVEDPGVCGLPVQGRGMCAKHYHRWQRHGDPLVVKRAGAPVGRKHSEETRAKIGVASRRRTASDVTRAKMSASATGRRASAETRTKMSVARLQEDPTYGAIHGRVTRTRGRAGEQPCSICPDQAANWCYDWNDVDAKCDEEGRWFSLDVTHYIPLCLVCHHRVDKNRLVLIV